MNDLESLFLIDPEVIFLNHGSFGATPRPVFEIYQEWQRRLEHQPVEFLVNELPDHLAVARQSLGNYINAGRDDVVYVPNATFALNIIARSLELGPNDEVLTSDHEYGACDNVWKYLSQKRGFSYRHQPLSFPIETNEAVINQLWQGVTANTKVIYLSHITSSTALRLPVEEICQLARDKGILSVIDGAHAPGQIPIDMDIIGSDFYFGNAHKWLCSPKGAGFLYTRQENQRDLKPLVVGWGWGEDRTFTFGSDYLDYMQWLGTNDVSAYLSVPAAIEFQETHDWPAVQQECHILLKEAIDKVNLFTNMPPCYPNSSAYYQMAVAKLPQIDDLTLIKDHFYNHFNIEIPFIQWQDQQFIRISIQGYNTRKDVDGLIEALISAIPMYYS